LLKGQTVGVIGAGRIGSAYARMMVSPPPFVSDQTASLSNFFQQNTIQIDHF